ncbi:MAG: acetyl-CoA carboxylase biotin carboxyl carrier protein subunit [Thermoanaerobaculia bacterium]
MEKFVIFNLGDGTYETKLTKKFLKRKPYQKEEGTVKAYIPGTISKVYVKKGSFVEKNTPLLVLEAMKMQNEIFSPFKGVVEEIFVKENEKVIKNQVLLKIKEE